MVRLLVRLCKHSVNTFTQKSTTKSKSLKYVTKNYNIMAMHQKKQLRKLQKLTSHLKIQVLGSGAPGTSVCLFLTSDHTNYVFNCGEGTQRLANEYGLKLSKVEQIFVTRPSWKNIGGLLGMLLTIQETGLSKVDIHSMGRIQELVDAFRELSNLSNFDISHVPINELEPYQDDVMQVHYVPIMKTSMNDQRNTLDLLDESQHSSNENGKRVIDINLESESLVGEAKKFKADTDLVCFICEVKPKPGKLLINKCIELGVEPGPLCKLLKDGMDVTLEDGRVVFSKDVCMPNSPKVIFMVVECPTKSYLDSLVNHSTFLKYQNSTSTEEEKKEVFCIFHITPEEILNDSQYQDWMKKFSLNTQHVILNSKNSGISSQAAHKNQCLLHLLHPEIFPLLREEHSKDSEEIKNNIYRGKVMQSITLRPETELITTPTIESNQETYIKEINEIFSFQETLSELQANINAATAEYDLAHAPEYPRIIMLGTGSCVPNKIRNTSGILLRIDEGNSILMDCGEGTLSQMIKFYGNSEVDNILRSIKAIYISHMHTDHHIGLIDILQRRGKCDKNLFLLAPHELATWLNMYDQQFEPISDLYTAVNNYDLYLHNHKLSKAFEIVFYDLLNVKEMNTVYVKHCKHAYGIAITLNDEKKIVYSGDTMPCENLLKLGKDCHLLIHEATMEDKLLYLASQKFHSTISQAINAGRLMNAKFTLLTHFSQRYAKIPIWSEEEKNVGLAYDNMEIKLSQLPLLHLFYPCLKVMFIEAYKPVGTTTTNLLTI